MSAHLAAFRALGTRATVVVTHAAALELALAGVHHELEAVDQACSRFREDSELVQLGARAGQPVVVSDRLFRALEVALGAAAATRGLVDPTLGTTLRALGYDRDFRSVPAEGPPLEIHLPEPRPGRWREVVLDAPTRTVRVPPGVELDLGATAKAWAADRAAAAAAERMAPAFPEAGVLVDLGGDVALAGSPPPAGWPVLITDDHATVVDPDGQCVTLVDGGLATSGVTVRTWWRGQARLHHLVDPRTGRPVEVVWRTATVAAQTCVAANIAATAAVVLGEEAPGWLDEQGLPARLVRDEGEVVRVGAWPTPELDRPTPGASR